MILLQSEVILWLHKTDLQHDVKHEESVKLTKFSDIY